MRFLLAFLALTLAVSAQKLARPAFDPARTWVLAVGILEWKDAETWGPFSKENRRDEQLVKAFTQLGVPADHIVLLQDRKATQKAFRSAIHATLKRTQAGDTLIFYYAGHGSHDGKAFYMVPYDGYEYESLISHKELTAACEDEFRGRRVLLTADCCHSGTLANFVKKGGHRKQYAAWTSSKASETSTGNWTFTDCMLDALRGEAYCDQNHDGTVTLGEVGNELSRHMQFVEEQQPRTQYSADFPGKTPFVVVPARALKEREGELVRVRSKGQLWPARVVESGKQGVKVHWLGNYEAYPDEWVKTRDIKK